MVDQVAAHYAGGGGLADSIAESLRSAGKDLDEFHIRGQDATLELAEQMRLSGDARVLDIGCGLGGPATSPRHTAAT